jgi:GT2 family glycosyltransferase
MDANTVKIAAIVLAYSRDKILPRLISAIRCQTRGLDDIIVINQGENPEISSYLSMQKDLIVVEQPNKGSAGGFCRGIVESIERGNTWTWIFDDDAIPATDALEALTQCPYFENEQTVFLGSRIVDPNGNTYMSPRGEGSSQSWYGTVLEDKCIESIDACWLGLLVSTQAVHKAGLPIAEFFLWDEDREFVSRLVRYGRGYCVLTSVITHYQDEHFEPFGKDFIKIAYYARNHVARAKLLPGSPWIKILKTASLAVGLLARVIRSEWPVKTVPWILKGIFLFWPTVKYIESSKKQTKSIGEINKFIILFMI